MSRRLDGAVAIVTGATSGIGVAVVERFAVEGAQVVATGRDRVRGNAVAEENGALFVAGDLTAPDTADRVVCTALDECGSVDILVNSAGLDLSGSLLETDVESVRRVLEVNVVAATVMLQAAARAMVVQGGGSIVNITSRLASVGVPTMAVYASSKGALLALTRAAAVELAPAGIRVNAVAPGMTRTPLYDDWLRAQADPAVTEQVVIEAVPQGRIAEPGDVASAVAFLASGDAAHITGASLPVDGGYTAA